MGPALFLLGAGLQGAGLLYSGSAEEAAADQEAAIMRRNSVAIRQQTVQTEEALRRKQASFLAEQRAAMTQSGFDSDSGTNRDIAYQSETLAELDAMTLRYEGEMRALGIQTAAGQRESEGKAARTASIIGAGGALLSGYGDYSKSAGVQLGGIE